MPYKEKHLFLMNFCLCGIAKVAIQCLSYKRLSVYFGRSCQMLVASTLISKEQIQQVLTIRRGIALAARYTPWDSSCLTQALIAKFWCQRYQILYLFFIGLAKESNQPLRRLFATRTSYDALDIRIEMTREKKKALLLVMAHTFLPLHNNGSELSS